MDAGIIGMLAVLAAPAAAAASIAPPISYYLTDVGPTRQAKPAAKQGPSWRGSMSPKYRNRRKALRPTKHANRLHISKRVRARHRRAKRAA